MSDQFKWDSGQKDGGISDHGALTGLGDDDHAQYLNEERHDSPDRHVIPEVVPHDPQKADNSTVVHLTGDEIIAGIKTFSSLPVLPAGNPTSANQAASKGYVDGIGKIVSIKNALFTGVQAASVAAQGSLAITNLSIPHACQNAANKVLLFGYAGQLANSDGESMVGLAFAQNGMLFPLGDPLGSRTRVGVGGRLVRSGSGFSGAGIAHNLFNLFSPGSIESRTYSLHVINIHYATKTLYINRCLIDSDGELVPRSTSGLLLIEVAE